MALSDRDAAAAAAALPTPAAKLTGASEFQLAEGWVCSHRSTRPLVWFNHSIKPQPEAADRKQTGLSLFPPSKYFLLTWWDKTVQHGWVKQRRCGSTVQLEVDIPDRTICLAVYAAGERKPQWLSTKCLYLEVQKRPCIEFTMRMSLYFQQHLKEHFPFVLLLQQ